MNILFDWNLKKQIQSCHIYIECKSSFRMCWYECFGFYLHLCIRPISGANTPRLIWNFCTVFILIMYRYTVTKSQITADKNSFFRGNYFAIDWQLLLSDVLLEYNTRFNSKCVHTLLPFHSLRRKQKIKDFP